MKTFHILVLCFLISFSTLSQLPEFKTIIYDSSSVSGYYFLADAANLMILDKIGNVVYYKTGARFDNFMLQPNGIMTYHASKKFYLMDSTFNVVDSVSCTNLPLTFHHDLRILADGHFLLIGLDSLKMNLSIFFDWKDRTGIDNAMVKSATIQELDANRNIVFEWRAKDHYAVDDADTFFIPNPVTLFDWTHPNALEIDHDGDILISNRNLNEITKISRKDGSIIWRFGGKKNQFKFIDCPVPFYGQHDVRRIANGHITLLDNGDHTISHGTRAMEFELDEVNKIATLKWSYTNDSTGYSTRAGNVQRLDNSNTLVNFGNTSNGDITFDVVNAKNNKIFQVNGMRSYRVYNYPSLPWQLRRPQIACYDSLGIKYLKTKQSYPSYQWSDSSNTRIIKITKPGAYSVFVPYGDRGYISSEKLVLERKGQSATFRERVAKKKKKE